MEMKHRSRKQSIKPVEVISASYADADDSSSRKLRAAKQRKSNKSASWTIWLGGSVVLIGLGFVLRQTDAAQDTNVQEAVVHVQDAVVESLHQAEDASSFSSRSRTALYGNLTSALYRFEASKLGPEYLRAIEKFDEYIGQTVDPVGAAFAAKRTRSPGPRKFHQECFLPPEEDKVLKVERTKKMHTMKGKTKLEFLREEQELFFGPSAQPNDTMITEDRKWAWRTAAAYSAQYAGRQSEFRVRVQAELNIPGQDDGRFFGGLVSGTFWYPPNAIREWHTNLFDMRVDERTGQPDMPWRMYYVRQKAATPDGGLDTSRTLTEDPEYFTDKSAMHLVDGPGIPPERLEEFGAYRLAKEDNDGPNVWRIPDQNGYVSLFRLQHVEPYRWHCIVVSDDVHRYSMGMSLDDAGVEALLRHAGVEL